MLALTLLTVILKLTKATKLARSRRSAATMVFQAGIFSFTGDLLIAIAPAINVFVIRAKPR